MQHSEPRGWWPKLPNKQDTLSWDEMLVEPPKVHATLCEDNCATDCPYLCLDVLSQDIGRLSNDAAFLNSLITHQIASLDVPVGCEDEYALRQFCLSVFSQNSTIVLRLQPSSEDAKRTVESLASIWPDHILVGQSPLPSVVEEGRTADETGLREQQPIVTTAVKAARSNGHPAGPTPNKGGTADRALGAMCTLGNHAHGIAISRDWVIALHTGEQGASVSSRALGYALFRRVQTSQPLKHWVPCRTNIDVLQSEQTLVAVAVNSDDRRRTRALRLVEEKDGYLHLSGNADDVGIGDFVLDAAGHLIGLVSGRQSPPNDGSAPGTIELLSIAKIWEDLNARADLGNSAACQALSDLTYVRDVANRTKPPRMRRPSMGRTGTNSLQNRQLSARRA